MQNRGGVVVFSSHKYIRLRANEYDRGVGGGGVFSVNRLRANKYDSGVGGVFSVNLV